MAPTAWSSATTSRRRRSSRRSWSPRTSLRRTPRIDNQRLQGNEMNLKSIYAGCAAMLLVLLSGCASTMKEGGAAFSEAKVEPGKALVYVYRQDAVDGNFVPNVWIVGA